MSQQAVETQNSTEQKDGATQSENTDQVESDATEADPAAEVEKWKKLARQNEDRAKANAAAAKKLAEIEDANKSELEKAVARAEAAEKAARDAERKAFAAEKGVPVSMITGATADEWEASVAAALEWKGESKTPAAPPANGQGNVGSDVRETKDLSADEIVSVVTKR